MEKEYELNNIEKNTTLRKLTLRMSLEKVQSLTDDVVVSIFEKHHSKLDSNSIVRCISQLYEFSDMKKINFNLENLTV